MINYSIVMRSVVNANLLEINQVPRINQEERVRPRPKGPGNS